MNTANNETKSTNKNTVLLNENRPALIRYSFLESAVILTSDNRVEDRYTLKKNKLIAIIGYAYGTIRIAAYLI